MSLPYLGAAEVAERLSPTAAIDALEDALLAGLDPEADPPRSALALAGGELLVMPSAASRAIRADVPDPHGERSTSPSAKIVTLRWCGPASLSPRSS